MFNFLLSNVQSMELGLLCLRVGIGLIFVIHGWGKITDMQQWHWLGSQMSHLGITFLPTFWGFLGAAAEFFGGLCLVFGFATRIASASLAFVMIIALLYHFNNGDGFKTYSHALSMLLVFVGLFLAGSGKMSLDYLLHGKKVKDPVDLVR
jgi:putative oxidoreductase